MKIAFRVDSSIHIGSGHISRCTALARALRRKGAEVVFVCAELHGSHDFILQHAGFDVLTVPEGDPKSDAIDTVATLGTQVDWLVVDHYGLGQSWEHAMRPWCGRILTLDDLANRPHEADVLLDSASPPDPERYRNLVPAEALLLLGPRYAPISSDITNLHSQTRSMDDSPRVLVFFGGSDPTDLTGRTLSALRHSDLSGVATDLVIGASNPHARSIRQMATEMPSVTVHDAAPSLAPLLARNTLGVGAGGVSMWERMCAGIPSIVVSLAANQVPSTHGVASQGVINYLGPDEAVSSTELRRALVALLSDPVRRKQMSDQGRALVDGRGATRVAEALIPSGPDRFSMRSATESDRELLFGWANDPEVRRNAIKQDPIPWSDHVAWFTSRIHNPKTLTYILEADGLPVGQVRFELTNESRQGRQVAVLDYSLDEVVRGRGLAGRMVCSSVHALRKHVDVPVVADVRTGNVASLRVLDRVGFINDTTCLLPGIKHLVLESSQDCISNAPYIRVAE